MYFLKHLFLYRNGYLENMYCWVYCWFLFLKNTANQIKSNQIMNFRESFRLHQTFLKNTAIPLGHSCFKLLTFSISCWWNLAQSSVMLVSSLSFSSPVSSSISESVSVFFYKQLKSWEIRRVEPDSTWWCYRCVYFLEKLFFPPNFKSHFIIPEIRCL